MGQVLEVPPFVMAYLAIKETRQHWAVESQKKPQNKTRGHTTVKYWRQNQIFTLRPDIEYVAP